MDYSFDSRGDCTVSSSLFWEKRERKREAQEKEKVAVLYSFISKEYAVYRQCKQEKENGLSETNKMVYPKPTKRQLLRKDDLKMKRSYILLLITGQRAMLMNIQRRYNIPSNDKVVTLFSLISLIALIAWWIYPIVASDEKKEATIGGVEVEQK